MSDLRLVVAGAGGRMGRTLVKAIAESKDFVLAGALEDPRSPLIGWDAGQLAGVGDNGIKLTGELAPLLATADPSLLQPPVNVLRLSLHPQGLAPRIVNLGQWRRHLFERLRQQIQATGDAGLEALLAELQGYPAGEDADATHLDGGVLGIATPLRLRSGDGVLNFISTTTIFGTPADVTLQELALETFFPADTATAQALRAMAGA